MSRILPLALIVAASAALAHAQPIKLKVTEPVGVFRASQVATGGVPVGPMDVRDVDELVVTDADGAPVPAQLSPMVRGADGRLRWVLVDLLTALKADERRTFLLKRRAGGIAPAQILRPVRFTQDDDTFTLANGWVRLVCSKKRFNLFEDLRVDRHGDGKFGDDERMLADERPDALTLIRGRDGAAFSTRLGAVERVSLEDAGPVRTTVRVDGAFGNAAGERWLKWTVRLTLWADRPDIRVLYALRNVNPKLDQQEQIRRASVTVRLAPPGGLVHYLVGAAEVNMSQLTAGGQGAIKGSQWHDRVVLEQVGPCEQVLSRTHRQFYHLKKFEDAGFRVRQFQPGGRQPFADMGFKCSGWIDLASDAGGCQLWLRNFTQDTPKRMSASVGGTLSVDVIPEYAGDEQPYYKGGGYWLGDRSYRTCELNFRFHAGPMLTDADWAKYRANFPGYAPPTEATSAKAEAIVQQARHPLQIVCEPDWYTKSGELWGPVVSLAEEAAANKALGRTKEGPVRPQPAGALATDFLHYENFHYRSEWDEPRDAIVEYLRTGDRRFYRRAHSFARNYRDLGVPRTDGLVIGQRARGVGGKDAGGPIPRWGQFCGCHNYGAGVIDMWLVTGDRSYRDAGIDYGYDHAQAVKAWGGFGGRNWGRKMISVLRTFQVTGDPKLKAWLLAHCSPAVPDDALRGDGRALICGKHMGSWMAGLTMHAVWHAYVTFRDELGELERDRIEDDLVGMARQVAKYWYFEQFKGGPYYIDFDKPGPGQVFANGGGMAYTSSCVDMITRGYLLTGDPWLLERARLFWNCVNGEDATTVSARLQDFHGMGSNGFWCRQLIHALAHPRPDAKAPAAINDLAAQPLGGGAVKLTWTAPIDVGSAKADSFQLKHAPLPMVHYVDYDYVRDHGKKWTWWAGHNVAGEPKPAEPGLAQSMLVKNVPPGTRYFAIRSRDASSNLSDLSNLVKVDVR